MRMRYLRAWFSLNLCGVCVILGVIFELRPKIGITAGWRSRWPCAILADDSRVCTCDWLTLSCTISHHFGVIFTPFYFANFRLFHLHFKPKGFKCKSATEYEGFALIFVYIYDKLWLIFGFLEGSKSPIGLGPLVLGLNLYEIRT